MLVSTIITNARLLADIPNTSFYTDAEALFATQLAWEQVYAFLASNNDDYFLTQVYLDMTTSHSVSADSNRNYVNLIDTTDSTDFADGFFRLRLIQYEGMGGNNSFYPVSKMTIENYGNTQNTPAYRLVGTNIAIYDPAQYQTYCIWYYPKPITLDPALDDDLAYPYNMIPEIMAYQVAAEIRRKQKADVAPWTDRVQELYGSMSIQMSRDDSHGEPIKNAFAQGFAPYI